MDTGMQFQQSSQYQIHPQKYKERENVENSSAETKKWTSSKVID